MNTFLLLGLVFLLPFFWVTPNAENSRNTDYAGNSLQPICTGKFHDFQPLSLQSVRRSPHFASYLPLASQRLSSDRTVISSSSTELTKYLQYILTGMFVWFISVTVIKTFLVYFNQLVLWSFKKIGLVYDFPRLNWNWWRECTCLIRTMSVWRTVVLNSTNFWNYLPFLSVCQGLYFFYIL